MPSRQISGVVVSDKMDKTRVVEVTRQMSHPKYHKVVQRSKRFKVHDPGSLSHVGDEVRIEETRPLSKTKRWRLLVVTKKAEQEVQA